LALAVPWAAAYIRDFRKRNARGRNMTIAVGDRVPEGVLVVRDGDGVRDVPVAGLLAGRSVVIFGLPGAYTGTCSTAHVPSFIRTMPQFKARGVDEVVCISVNDSHVMKAWGEATGATAAGITMASDSDASVTKALGLDFAAAFVRGAPRSRRYAMHVVDGVVKVLNVEDNNGACSISAGEGLLDSMG
jgi:glutaredoxin/glutathione-dependent peroxiredoxin